MGDEIRDEFNGALAQAMEGRESSGRTVMGRGLMLLEALSRAGRPLSLTALTNVTHLPKSTVHRMAKQLVELGLLERWDDRFSIGLRIFEWGSNAERQRDLRRVAVPYLTELHTRLGGTVHLGVLDGRDVLYVEKIEGHAAVRCPTYVGGRRPAHGTALGKAMLAFTPGALKALCSEPLDRQTSRTIIAPGILYRQLLKVRETQVSVEHEESFPGVACVAAPILDSDNVARGAISVTASASRFNAQQLAPIVLGASRNIARDLNELAADKAP